MCGLFIYFHFRIWIKEKILCALFIVWWLCWMALHRLLWWGLKWVTVKLTGMKRHKYPHEHLSHTRTLRVLWFSSCSPVWAAWSSPVWLPWRRWPCCSLGWAAAGTERVQTPTAPPAPSHSLCHPAPWCSSQPGPTTSAGTAPATSTSSSRLQNDACVYMFTALLKPHTNTHRLWITCTVVVPTARPCSTTPSCTRATSGSDTFRE